MNILPDIIYTQDHEKESYLLHFDCTYCKKYVRYSHLQTNLELIITIHYHKNIYKSKNISPIHFAGYRQTLPTEKYFSFVSF